MGGSFEMKDLVSQTVEWVLKIPQRNIRLRSRQPNLKVKNAAAAYALGKQWADYAKKYNPCFNIALCAATLHLMKVA
jgi:hypothetical protein